MAAPSSYYFIPYLEVNQTPNPPFTWKTDAAQNCTAQREKCLGYTSSGNGFDSNILKEKGAKLAYINDPNKGSYFNDQTKFGAVCAGYLGGQLDASGTKCNITSAQASAALQKLSSQGHISTFDGGIGLGGDSCLMNIVMIVGLVLLVYFIMKRMKK